MVTESSRHSYSTYLLLTDGAFVTTYTVLRWPSELGKHPLFDKLGVDQIPGPGAGHAIQEGGCRSPNGRHRRPEGRGGLLIEG